MKSRPVLTNCPGACRRSAFETSSGPKLLRVLAIVLTIALCMVFPHRGITRSAMPVVQSASMVATFASDCTTPKTVFNLQDADKTVCAKIAGAQPGWQVIWSNANFVAVQTNTLSQSDQNVNFTLNPNSSLGDWRVILFEPFGGTVQAVTTFTVVDAANPVADLTVNTGSLAPQAAPGTQVLFSIEVQNLGPSDAVNVNLSDVVPDNTTFVSFAQLSGPVFSCSNPSAGSTGTTVCTIPSLQRGETASFTATYEVSGSATSGTQIDNTATAASDTTDPHPDNNSSTASVEVASPACILTCVANITVGADSGQAGALVSFADPDAAGDCGQPATGEGGEVIPPVSCNPPSGSFFPVGTSTVICASQTGAVCSFQVTVENPGGLSITLNGPNPLSLECGEDFNDPGASAVNGSGQSISVTVSGTVDSHTPGSYTLTYTATEDPNSTSTTRTVNVADNAGPVITIGGSNPLTLSCGQAFVDPGVSAVDSCEGSKPVSSSGTVNPNVPGTYTITYTSVDSHNRTSTATRSVIVEAGGGNVPPTITLSGGPQIEWACGVPFVDPGATASVPCGGSVQVTSSGTVDVHTTGTYTITYTACVQDSPGHCDPNLITQVQRTVEVVPAQLSALGQTQIWVGLKNSDDVGTKFDLLAEVLRNGVVVGSGQLNGVAGGSSGFNNAILDAISMSLATPGDACSGTLSLRLSVRVAANSGHVSGTARLWFNDSAANSRFSGTVGGSAFTYYLRDGFVLAATPGPGPKKTVDVTVNRNQNGNPFKPFGTWTLTL
jgi:uncharacterized repeat protein (TIGR01451 family)